MKHRAFAAVLLLSSLFVLGHAAQAQCGGKAEPNRIAFKRGMHSATVKGKLRGDEQAEYTFDAYEGQGISISVASVPKDAISIEVQTPADEVLELQPKGTKWTGTLPASGYYFMVVKLAEGCGPSRATYTLTLAIK